MTLSQKAAMQGSRLLTNATLLAVLLAGTACVSERQDVVMTGLSTPTRPERLADARNADLYPNLNIMPASAAAQITPDERAAREAELAGARQRVAAKGRGARQVSEVEELRRIGRTHGPDTLKAIAAQ